jgi:hypothetical protein
LRGTVALLLVAECNSPFSRLIRMTRQT